MMTFPLGDMTWSDSDDIIY